MLKKIVFFNLLIAITAFCKDDVQQLKAQVEKKNNKLIINISKDLSYKKIYLIKKGDTLAKIAKLYNSTIKKIAKDNNIKNIDLIFHGKSLIIK